MLKYIQDRIEWLNIKKQIDNLSNDKYQVKAYDIEAFHELFRDFPKPALLNRQLNALQSGTRIGLRCNAAPRLHHNNPRFSDREKIGIGTQLIKWLKRGVVIGPIDSATAQQWGLTLNQIFGVPKPDGSTRPILNLSDDDILHYSVNDLLDPSWCTIEYIQTKELIQIVSALGPNAYLWAQDLSDGYYNVSVHLLDINNLACMFDKKIYVFQRLPMGLSSSPKIFSDFMAFILWAVKHNRPEIYYITVDLHNVNLNFFRAESGLFIDFHEETVRIPLIFHYLDDILGGHCDEQIAIQQFNHTKQILNKLSLDAKASKSKPPNQKQIWLGKLIDTVAQTISLPRSKVDRYVNDLKELLTKKSVTKRQLLSHIGRTRHMATIYHSLAAFARSLEIYAYSVRELHHFININTAFKRDVDLCIWAIERASSVGVAFDFILKPRQIPDITITTDASSSVGIGGFDDRGKYFQNRWQEIPELNDYPRRDIQWMELCAIFVFIHHSAPSLRNKTVHIYTDNIAVKYMLIKMRSKLKRPDLQILINTICKLSIEYQFHIWIDHIEGQLNVIADALSRFEDVSQYDDDLINELDTLPSLVIAFDLCKNIVMK